MADNEPKPSREAIIFRFNSPGFNRSKYLVLYTIRELEHMGYATSFNVLYVNSAVCYRGCMATPQSRCLEILNSEPPVLT
ncbi:hypothetical protein ACFLYL_04900 [Chloroflexota bacterium]